MFPVLYLAFLYVSRLVQRFRISCFLCSSSLYKCVNILMVRHVKPSCLMYDLFYSIL